MYEKLIVNYDIYKTILHFKYMDIIRSAEVTLNLYSCFSSATYKSFAFY